MAGNSRSPIQKVDTSNWWKYFIWIFLAWILLYLLLGTPWDRRRYVDIPYSQFKTEVKKDNVKTVKVKGQEITGSFKKEYKPGEENKAQAESYSSFRTIKPPFEDSELIPLLEQKKVTLSAQKEDNSWLPFLLLLSLPWLLLIGIFVFRAQQTKGTGGLFNVGKSRAKRYDRSTSETTFNDVAGAENAKRDLREIIEYLKNPKKFTALGADIPNGILLMGPPGCGKTLLARAAAGEAEVPFFSISGSEFIEMLVGVGASRVRSMFENAKKEAPSIIFIDEIDSVGRVRGSGIGGGHDEREQTLNQILSEMDGFEPHVSVVVMAATNRPDVLDPALTRPGRFDRQIVVELPHKDARLAILKIHTRIIPLSKDVDLANLAGRTVGFSGADLKNLANEAALLAGRKNKKKVDSEDFEEARDKILMGAVREEKIEEDEKKIVAYHESGHALVAKLLPDADPLQKVTIIPRGQSLGATEQVPETERHNLSRSYLMDRIAVLLGGRASEKLVFDQMTSGAGNDLKAATQLVRKMVCQWGMSDKLGPVTYPLGEDHPFLGREMAQPRTFSEHTAQMIDEEIQGIIVSAEKKAGDLLEHNRKSLDALAAALLEHESLENDEVDRILEAEPVASEA